MQLLVDQSLQRVGLVGVGAVTSSRASLRCVLQIPICGYFMCPLAFAGLGLRYCVTPVAVKLGHPLRYTRQMAFRTVEILGLHKDLCANQMLLVIFHTVCVKKAFFMGLCAWVLAQSAAANIVMALLL